MSKTKLLLIAIPCVLGAVVVRSCYMSDYEHSKPTKLGTVSIPEKQMTISLFCKSKPRAVISPYDGEYRILEVAQLGKPTLYYDLPATIPDDRCHMEIFWYATNKLVRFRDTELTFAANFRSESVLNLDENILYCAIRRGDRITHLAKLSAPMPGLTFPKRKEKSRIADSYGTSGPSSGGNISETIMIGNEVAQPIDASWTRDQGVLIGIIAPKGSK